jgi:hypothetical protein
VGRVAGSKKINGLKRVGFNLFAASFKVKNNQPNQ